MSMKLIVCFYIGLLHAYVADGTCTLPMADGNWLSSTRGTWTVSGSGTSISNFEADLSKTLSTATLSCVQDGSTSTQYVLGTSFEIFFGVTIDVYTCLDIRTTDNSPSSYVYYIVTPTDSSTGEQFTSDINSVCVNTDFETAIGTHVIVSSGSEANATIHCPDVILGNYSLTYTDVNSNTISGSLMDSCSDTKQMAFTNGDTSVNLAFTSGSLVQCVHTVTSGSYYYVHTYNNDSSVDNTNTYTFACWVFAYDGSDVKGTAYPKECHLDQSSTAVQFGGQTFSFTPYVTCPRTTSSEDAAGLAGWVIALIVIGILLLILLIVIIVVCCLLKRQQRQTPDEEKVIIKEEKVPKFTGERQPSPVEDPVINEKIKAQAEFVRTDKANFPYGKKTDTKLVRKKEDDYDSGFEDKGMLKDTFKLKDKTIREHTFELVEVKKDKGKKLKDGKPAGKSSETIVSSLPLPNEDLQGQKEPPNTDRTGLTGRKEPPTTDRTILTNKKEPPNTDRKNLTNRKEPPTTDRTALTDKKEPLVTDRTVLTDRKTETDRTVLTDKTETTGGKMSIPPTAPRPADDDTTLIRIRKEKEKKEKELKEKKKKEEEAIKKKKEKEASKKKIPEVKVEKVAKVIRESSSSGEYETDESEKEERIQKLIEKRKRLAGASYEPPEGLTDAFVVGRKKRGNRRGKVDDDLTKNLVGRQQQERLDREKKERKKALKRLARKKIHRNPDEAESTDSDVDSTTRKHKRRKAGDPHGKQAPYIEQYHLKKDIEDELDDMDFWQENNSPDESIIMADADLTVDESKAKAKAKAQAPLTDTLKHNTGERTQSKLELIMQEECDVWDQEKGIPLPGNLGYVGLDGELPEGFIQDEDGNIVRQSDSKLILSQEQLEKQLEMRRKLCHVFGLPRLVRDTDGRPVGGYKDDEFGPTAEWDYGDANEANEVDDEQNKSEAPTALGKTVVFSDSPSVPTTPLKEVDYSQRKGRQIGSADRDLLKQRLFEQQQRKKQKDSEQDKHMPVYFVGKKGGVKPESVYIDNSQIERQDLNPVKFQRTQSLRGAPASSNMVMRSDTFDDGRQQMYRDGLGKDKRFLNRNSRLRSSWTGEASGTQGSKRDLGSDDEFILVGGSFKKLNRPPDTPDADLPVHLCPRYERHGFQPVPREPTLLSDISMRTAPDSSRRPFSGDDRRLRQYLGELYKDKKYFDYYLETEELPTNAAVETRGLANHGRDFLLDRAEYWKETQPEPPKPPPSELGIRLSRMQTLYTIADSGLDSRMSTRPHSADDAPSGMNSYRRNDSILRERSNGNFGNVKSASQRSDDKFVPSASERIERLPPTGRSELHRSPSKLERLEEANSQDGLTEDDKLKETEKEQPKSDSKDNLTVHKKQNAGRVPPGNVLSITES